MTGNYTSIRLQADLLSAIQSLHPILNNFHLISTDFSLLQSLRSAKRNVMLIWIYMNIFGNEAAHKAALNATFFQNISPVIPPILSQIKQTITKTLCSAPITELYLSPHRLHSANEVPLNVSLPQFLLPCPETMRLGYRCHIQKKI